MLFKGKYELRITSLTQNHTGEYRCTAVNSNGRVSSAMWLAVVPKDSFQDASSQPKNSINSGLMSHQSANFYFQNPLTPKNDSSENQLPVTRLKRAATFDCISNSSRNCQFRSLSPAQSNEDLPKNFEKSAASIRRRAPGFLSRPVSSTLTPGSKLTLSAKLLGHPSPKVIWEKDGFQLSEKDERIKIISQQNSHCLEVRIYIRYCLFIINNLG